MRLSGKIFGMMGLLIFVSLLITGLGIYGMTEIFGSIKDYIRLSSRSVAIGNINQIAQRLTIVVENLIIETDDATLKTMIEDVDYKNAAEEVSKELDKIAGTINPDSPQWVEEMPKRIADSSRSFIDAVTIVADLAIQNTDIRTQEILALNAAIWNDYANTVRQVESDVRKREGGEKGGAIEEMLLIFKFRTSRLYFERDSYSLITTIELAGREALIKNLRQYLDEISTNINSVAAVFAGDPANGARLAGLTRQLEQLRVNIEKIANWALQNGDNKAYAYSASTAKHARQQLNEVLRDYIGRSEQQ
ncbi:MAG: hypothetical protein LBE84_02765, partial [Planctomycetota bacterium]|nr:hypothetical protein [Planctomycetota bacterium]